MAANSSIEWTEASWNCLAGCEATSPGCAKCYAATMTRRLEAMGQADYAGLTTDKHFNGVVRCLPHKLDIPLRWKKPRRVFVNSMSDLFHEDVPDEFIDRVFAVMALCPQHTFQVLTKRAERMAKYLGECFTTDNFCGPMNGFRRPEEDRIARFISKHAGLAPWKMRAMWPLPNVWLGVSVEDQKRADERIPLLLQTPAAVRFISAEPLLGPVELEASCGDPDAILPGRHWLGPPFQSRGMNDGIDWVIVGGESGPGARPCNIEWIRSLVAQCKAAGTACFVKQLGSTPFDKVAADDFLPQSVRDLAAKHGVGPLVAQVTEYRLRDKKGGDWSEWPEDLRVREFPTTEATDAR